MATCQSQRCGRSFEPVRAGQRYCSEKCRDHEWYIRNVAPPRLVTLTCEFCGEEFMTTAMGGRDGRKWCSTLCGTRARQPGQPSRTPEARGRHLRKGGSPKGNGNGCRRRWEFSETLLVLTDERSAMELHLSGLIDRTALAIEHRRTLLRQRAVAVGGVDRLLDLMYSSTIDMQS